MRKIAFVGAEERKLLSAGISPAVVENHLLNIMQEVIAIHGRFIFISGASPKGGVDLIAEDVADVLRLDKMIFPPAVHKWSGSKSKMGYKQRNIAIAEECDILYNIDPEGVYSGGQWTLRFARELGKVVHRIEITHGGLLIWS